MIESGAEALKLPGGLAENIDFLRLKQALASLVGAEADAFGAEQNHGFREAAKQRAERQREMGSRFMRRRRTQVHDVGAAILDKSVTNGDVYIVATKTITQWKMVPIILSGGVRGTNAELWGMGGNTPNFQERAFGAAGFVFKGPAHTSFILASEFSQQPRHPSELPTAIIPTTITYAIRFVPTPEHKINFDFGVAQIAGQIAPGVNLQARAQVARRFRMGFNEL